MHVGRIAACPPPVDLLCWAPALDSGRRNEEDDMRGFKDFLLRGNLIELAVAFIMGTVFAAVVTAFTKIVLDVLGLVVQVEGLSDIKAGGVNIGNFVTALITFVLTAAVLYFVVVVPYNKLSAIRKGDEPEKVASSEDLLAEIRDLLRDQSPRA